MKMPQLGEGRYPNKHTLKVGCFIACVVSFTEIITKKKQLNKQKEINE